MSPVRIKIGDDYLTAFDPDAHGEEVYPTGAVAVGSFDQALTFTNFQAAVDYTMQVSTLCPRRPDGRPNCPLRTFDLEFELG